MPATLDAALAAGLNGNLVYKFGTGGVWLADYSVACPATVLNAAQTDVVIPTGFVFAGWGTVDGITINRAQSNTNLMGWQSTQAVRNDVESDVTSLDVKLMENNAVTIAIQTKQLISTVPVKPGVAGAINNPVDGAEPARRGIWVGYDRKHDVIKAQILPQLSLTTPNGQSVKRTDANTLDCGFTAYFDPAYGTDARTIWGGAGWLAAAVSAAPTV